MAPWQQRQFLQQEKRRKEMIGEMTANCTKNQMTAIFPDRHREVRHVLCCYLLIFLCFSFLILCLSTGCLSKVRRLHIFLRFLFCWVFPSLSESFWVSLSFTKFYWVLLSFTESGWYLLSFVESCWVRVRYYWVQFENTEFSLSKKYAKNLLDILHGNRKASLVK